MFTGSPGKTIRATITGIVLDENNAPQNAVTVTSQSQTTTTNQYGVFVLRDVYVNKERCIIQFNKTGYFNRSHAFIASENTVNYVRIVLISNAQTHTLSATAGGTVMLADNSSILFAPNSFVTSTGSTYNGTVNLTVKHLSPDAANFGFMIPGGDLAGKDLNDEDVSLYTYGMLGVELKGSSGETLQLAAGTTATLTMSIAVSQQSSAPTAIPLWYFDEATSQWKEEGVATKIGNNYVGTVTHFSWWNCDYQGPRSTVKGKVVDCANFPVPNVVVTIDGNGNTITNQNGEYTNWIPSGYSFTIQVLAINNPGWLTQDSQIETIPVLSPGQIFIVPDLVIPCPTRVSGTIKTCSGENTPGMVSISGGNIYMFQYTQNGNFALPVLPNTPLTITASNSSHNATQNISPVLPQTNFNVGDILLCAAVNSFPNSFTVTGGNVPNQAYNINTSVASAQIIDSLGSIATGIYITGVALPQFTISSYSIYITDTVPGTFAGAETIHIVMSDPLNSYSMLSTSHVITLTQVDLEGGRVKGNYYGVFSTYINGSTSSNVNISGEFDVLRVQ